MHAASVGEEAFGGLYRHVILSLFILELLIFETAVSCAYPFSDAIRVFFILKSDMYSPKYMFTDRINKMKL